MRVCFFPRIQLFGNNSNISSVVKSKKGTVCTDTKLYPRSNKEPKVGKQAKKKSGAVENDRNEQFIFVENLHLVKQR